MNTHIVQPTGVRLCYVFFWERWPSPDDGSKIRRTWRPVIFQSSCFHVQGKGEQGCTLFHGFYCHQSSPVTPSNRLWEGIRQYLPYKLVEMPDCKARLLLSEVLRGDSESFFYYNSLFSRYETAVMSGFEYPYDRWNPNVFKSQNWLPIFWTSVVELWRFVPRDQIIFSLPSKYELKSLCRQDIVNLE